MSGKLRARLSIEIGSLLAVSLVLLGILHYFLPTYFGGERYYSKGWNDPYVWTMLYGYLLFFGLLPSAAGFAAGAIALIRALWAKEGARAGAREAALIGILLNLAFWPPPSACTLLCAAGATIVLCSGLYRSSSTSRCPRVDRSHERLEPLPALESNGDHRPLCLCPILIPASRATAQTPGSAPSARASQPQPQPQAQGQKQVEVEVEEDEEAPAQRGPRPPRPRASSEGRGQAKSAGSDKNEDVARLFRAKQVLSGLGIRYLTPEASGDAGGPAGGCYRGQITAPSLAFLAGLSDQSGGLPLFRSPVFVTLEGPGRILIFVDISGEVRGPGGEKTGVKVYDPRALPGTVQLVQRSW